ncbi:TPA: hypothetical protein ACOFD1_001565 [Stenotrophomonas maltophilia]|nr:hypothetical protein [Stenotrophomonas maltophilia]UBB19857.1 hypothetical protein LAD79_12380 [Stenotrophomonas maltophilia]
MRDVAIWDWSNKSEVFGNQIPSADPDGDGVAFELALRFPGQQATDASGLFYNYQRNTSLQWGGIRRVIALDYFGGLQALRMLVGILFHSPILWDCAKTIMVLMRPFIKRHMGYFKSCMSYVQPPTWLTLPVSSASVLILFVEVPFVAGVATVGGGALASYEVGAAIVCAMAGIQTLQ